MSDMEDSMARKRYGGEKAHTNTELCKQFHTSGYGGTIIFAPFFLHQTHHEDLAMICEYDSERGLWFWYDPNSDTKDSWVSLRILEGICPPVANSIDAY